jgi:hypothetical protein
MKYIFPVALSLFIISCYQNKTSSNCDSLNFLQDTIFINKIPIGDSIVVKFKFFNECDAPIKIVNVGSSCGCTVGDYSKESINKGDSGLVRVTYKNGNDTGRIIRTLVVESDGQRKLTPLYILTHE